MTTLLPQASQCRKLLGWRHLLLLTASLLLVLLGVRLWAARSFESGPMPPSLRTAGNISVGLPNGQLAPLNQFIRPGLPTVISLWTSWCGPCRLEAPHIVALRRRFGPDELNLVYLNVREDGASPAELADYLRSVGMRPEAYVAMRYRDLVRLTNDQQNLIPRTYVFDRNGAPVAMIVGYKPMALARVAKLLTGMAR